jgi:hypothetical protein
MMTVAGRNSRKKIEIQLCVTVLFIGCFMDYKTQLDVSNQDSSNLVNLCPFQLCAIPIKWITSYQPSSHVPSNKEYSIVFKLEIWACRLLEIQ